MNIEDKMKNISHHITDEQLSALIVVASNEKSFDLRNALMELRGLRAVHSKCNPAVFVTENGLKMIIQ
jgi:hypothetical protein